MSGDAVQESGLRARSTNLLLDPNRVVARWEQLKPSFRASTKEPQKNLQSLGVAADNDRERWSGGPFYSDWAHGDNPKVEETFLSDWLRTRITWIDSTLNP